MATRLLVRSFCSLALGALLALKLSAAAAGLEASSLAVGSARWSELAGQMSSVGLLGGLAAAHTWPVGPKELCGLALEAWPGVFAVGEAVQWAELLVAYLLMSRSPWHGAAALSVVPALLRWGAGGLEMVSAAPEAEGLDGALAADGVEGELG